MPKPHSFPSPDHDHRKCVADALAAAERTCATRGARLTEQRRRVLEIIWSSHAPVGAYDVLDALGQEGKRVAPMTVYRALDFLIAQGLVHRLASLNAYIGCGRPSPGHSSQFLICRDCGQVAELEAHAIDRAITADADKAGFVVERQLVEIEGLCPSCRFAGREMHHER